MLLQKMDKRIIKFRGKRVNNGEWVYGNLMVIEDTYFIIEPVDFSYNNDTDATAFWFNCTEQEVDPATVGQYTGLEDKKKAEIWEGDVLEKTGDYSATETPIGSRDVATMNRFPHYWLKHEVFGFEGEELEDPNKWEVIGNAYDHPELLEPKEY